MLRLNVGIVIICSIVIVSMFCFVFVRNAHFFFNLEVFVNCSPQKEEQNFSIYNRHSDLGH